MAKFKVEYVTDTKPSIYALPVGAKVVQTSVLPVEVKGSSIFGDTTLTVEKSSNASGNALVRAKNAYDSVTIRVSKAQALQVIEALKEIAGA